eukprot:1200240-Amorphochlora_amoeboformis.AAC.2
MTTASEDGYTGLWYSEYTFLNSRQGHGASAHSLVCPGDQVSECVLRVQLNLTSPGHPNVSFQDDDLPYLLGLAPFPDEMGKHWRRDSLSRSPDRRRTRSFSPGAGRSPNAEMPDWFRRKRSRSRSRGKSR